MAPYLKSPGRGPRPSPKGCGTRLGRPSCFVTHDAGEAVPMSNRIITMSHDGKVFADTQIDLPSPCLASDPDFAIHQAEILARFEHMEATRAAAPG